MYTLMNAYKVSACENIMLIEEENVISIHILPPSSKHLPMQKDYMLGTPSALSETRDSHVGYL